MVKGTRIVRGWGWLALLLVGASLGGLAGCGGDERLSREEFADRVQSIDRRESARFARLAQQAMRLGPDEALTEEVRGGMREFAGALRVAADELEALNPPKEASEATDMLVAALRERAAGFEEAAGRERVTIRELERDGSITRAGDKVDRAFERLRTDGFLPGPSGDHQ